MNQNQRISELRSLRGRLRNLSTRTANGRFQTREERERERRNKVAAAGAGVAGAAGIYSGAKVAAPKVASISKDGARRVGGLLSLKAPLSSRRILTGKALMQALKGLK